MYGGWGNTEKGKRKASVARVSRTTNGNGGSIGREGDEAVIGLCCWLSSFYIALLRVTKVM